jgi:DedD protein
MTVATPIRYRMAGAILLIFLSVLFLPWLLDGAGYEYLQDLDEPIPERPLFVEPQLSGGAEGLETAQERAPDGMPPAPWPEARNQPGSTVDIPPAPARTPVPVSAAPAPERESVGWAVQVGSFGREANAREQMQRLREAGYAAFIEKAALDRNEVWRVKIGPEVQRDRALRVRDDIQKQLNISGIVIAHP